MLKLFLVLFAFACGDTWQAPYPNKATVEENQITVADDDVVTDVRRDEIAPLDCRLGNDISEKNELKEKMEALRHNVRHRKSGTTNKKQRSFSHHHLHRCRNNPFAKGCD